ncbi:uncharacterized protein LOC108347396 isoform X2 [Vigna angularis]|uniref:uncharacterized protein LOC108347396 isoform X2 n=1 Tax=Phaseolus angularis TaxID=3914 RepID=UPI0022B2EBE8|nr:uncharacterized protein LOC108347396 isoform X2 [Vigna angularis]
MDPIVSTTTESALNITASVVKRQVGYLFNYKDKFKELKSYIEKLENNKERLQHQVDSALRSGDEIEKDVQHCLTFIDDKIKEYKSFINDDCHAKTICSIGFFPNNFRLRYQLGRKATKMVEEIIGDELWKTFFDNVSYQEFPSIDATFSNNVYESFASRTKTMEMIMKALQDSTVGMIGVYGPGGVGKTTLVKEIANKAREKNLFEIIIIANITGNPDFKKIQEQIAVMLGMKLEEESEIARVERIRKRLKNEKENTLIILDDLWGGLDFDKLGIPCNDDASQQEVNDISDFGYNKTEIKELSKVDLDKMKKEKLSNDYRGGKILLTSRNKQVLCNEMDVQQRSIFSVGVLDEKESETLLKKVAGVKNSEFDRSATEIAKWSAGFPIALVSIGRTLKNKSLSTWEDVCQQIKRQNFTSEWGFTDFSIKLSYDHLKNEELKCIFLHCARMGSDALIMDLVKFCVGLDLLPGVHTITDARKRVKEMIQELEESSLLVKSYSIDRFNMHDIVRDVALSISSKEKHVLYKKNAILYEWPHENDFERYSAIFVHFCDINDELPESIHCPQLEVLHIDNKNESFEIPDEFFKSMVRLRVLVLTGINLSCLPSSIKCLKKLRMLCLERCTLGENLSIIGELKNLRILTLSGSNIENLPLEFGQLDKLQFLDISNCLKLRQITSNIIPRMGILEEFYIRDNLIIWEAEENMKSENASLSELMHLNQLQNLDIHIHCSSYFPQNLFFDRLNSYKIVIGEFNLSNLLKVGEFKVPDKYEETPGSPQSLQDQVFQQRNKDIVVDVEHMVTNSCLPLFNEKVSTPKLEWLELSSINIHKIWSDQCNHCFQNLLTLNVTDCSNLKYLLSFSMAESLVNLQSIFVSECAMMEDIFRQEDAEYIDVFPKLKKMEIICMDKLCTIWKSDIGLHSFSSLNSLMIRECHKLVTIFPNYMGQILQSLQSLTVTDCKWVENIFDFENIPHTCDIIETNLGKIILENLPNLVNVWKGYTGEILKCNNLQSIRVYESPKLKYLFPVSIANDLEKQEVLEVRNCGVTEIIALDKHSCETAISFKFPHLNTLSLIDLHDLRSFYSGIHTLELPPLKKLDIINCSMLQGLTSEITDSKEQPIVLAAKKAIYNLEYMSLSLKEAEWLQKYIVNVHRMHKLEELTLYGLKNNEILFWFLHRLPNLKRLTLELCHLKRIWALKSLISREKIGGVVQLKELKLESMWSLEEIGFEHEVLLQRVERLSIQHCTKLKNLVSSSVTFSYLTYLEVMNCKSMRSLMTCSTAKTLVQLTTLKVCSCPMIVEIVAENKVEKVREIEFKQLKSLELVSLQNLTSFSRVEKCDLKFPLLEKLVVSECPQMTKLSEVQSAPNLQKVHVEAGEKDQWYWEGDLNATLQTHFTNQVSFEYSKYINLVDYPEKKVRHDKFAFPDNFFGCLKKLEFNEACKRDTLIPSHVLPYLKNLEELNVEKCESAKLIFDIDERKIQMYGMVFRLKTLTLKQLSNLKCVWKENLEGIVSFSNLQRVDVDGCRSLLTLFPLSLAKDLGKLETLDIKECEKMIEIVGREDEMEHGTTIMFEFPCLSYLNLENMPLLSCFYLGKHHLECPLLDRLYVACCPRLKLFRSSFDDDSKKEVLEAPTDLLQQPLFSIQKVSPKPMGLTLNEESIKLMSDARLPQDLLCKLKCLILSFEDDNNGKDSLPFGFLHKLPNLESLTVQKCSGLKEIFPSQKLQVHDNVLAELKGLFLFELSELESIGLEHTWVQPYSKKLDSLFLYGCHRVENIVSCAVSFINLKDLFVVDCKRMEYLFTSATLKSLVKLETLFIGYCGSIKEIARNEEEDGCDEIIFGRLRSIKLEYLPWLISFYSGNATLQCPCLQNVMVTECPNMITFSEGVIKLAMFSGIQTSEDSDFTFHVDLNTTVESLFHEKEIFNHSKHMILDEYLEITGVQHIKPDIANNFFGSFKELEFHAACKRAVVIPFHLLPYLKNLEKLNVHSSDAVKVIFDFDESEDKTKGIVSSLKELTLKNLSNLKCVWKENLGGIVSFPNLEEVIVTDCRSLVTLLSSSLAKSVEKLKTLRMDRCEKLKEIVGEEDEREHGMTLTFEFPCLTVLFLLDMPLLSCFYPGKHYLECPILDSLCVAYCPKLKLFTSDTGDSHKEEVIEAPISPLQQPLFLMEKVSPKLKKLALNVKNIMLLRDGCLPHDLLCKLSHLWFLFEDYEIENDTLHFDFFHKLPSLEYLHLEKCFGLKVIFPSQKLQVHDKVLAGLKQLSLMKLSKLESIGLEHEWVQLYSRKLELLKLHTCPQVENIVSCSVSFINLTKLYVKLCEKMEYLFTFATFKSLVKLMTLSIKNCESIKEIVKKEEEDACDEIVFGQLRSIKLNSLPKLLSFYSGNATLKFLCLQSFMVAKCPNMITFSEGVINMPILSGIKTSKDSVVVFHDNLNTIIETSLHEQEFMEYSKRMILEDYLGMSGVHHRKPIVSENFFGSFKKLEFDAACNRTILIPSHVLPYLKNLEELNVKKSDAMQIIFDIDESEVKTKGVVFGLKKLTLNKLSNLKHVWKENSTGMISFHNLQEVVVNGCGSLITLFSSSLARNLGKLEKLHIKECGKLVEIVEKEDGTENGTKIMFEFPCLTWLYLKNMPLLNCFYPGKHDLDCPLLEILLVCFCPKLKLFTSDFDENQKGAIEAQISPLQQPMFSVERVSPRIKALALNEENIMLFREVQLLQDILCNIAILGLCFEDDNIEKDSLPFDFLNTLPNVLCLVIKKCFGLKEIFPSQKLQVHDEGLAGLKQLFLVDLKELESVGLEHPWVQPYSEKLQQLSLKRCPQLQKLVYCAVSFINLEELCVKLCERMEYLFTFATVKSLVKLKTLTINSCESIKEIIKHENEDGCADMVFGRLKSIKLKSLPRLVRFYSGKATLQCSYLKVVMVVKCPSMKTFSEGVMKVPKFSGIQTSKDSDLIFHEDLNTTIKKLFHEEVEKSACDLEHLKFGDHPNLEEIWLGVAPIPRNDCFNNLQSIAVVECESLSNVIPFYLLRFLSNLKEIEVSNCQSVKAIFDVRGEGTYMKPISLPLKKLILNQLPNLEHIWNLNPDEILSLQDLQQVSISNCQTLKSLFPTSVANHLVKLHVRACATLVKIFVETETASEVETKQFNFHCLTSITLWELPELKYLYPGKHTLEWPMLTHLDIYHCDQLKLFKTEHHSDEFSDKKDQLGISIHQQPAFSVKKVFPKLVQLSLKKEDAMAILQGQLQVIPSIEHQAITWKDTRIGQGQFGANVAQLLQNLKLLKLMCYHEDDKSNIFSSGLLEEIPNIENLEVVCSSFTEIFCSQGPTNDCSKVLLKLKRLHLKNLPQLNTIGLEHSWVEPLLKTLETLEVFSCPNMKILGPSTLSFSSLTTLSVDECHGLLYLFTSSTAKRLGQLKHFSIRDCQAIQEIVSKEEDHESEDEDITFDQLSFLSLQSLPNIVVIYSGTFKLKFPCLDQVTIKECPQMKYSYVPDLHEFKPQERT